MRPVASTDVSGTLLHLNASRRCDVSHSQRTHSQSFSRHSHGFAAVAVAHPTAGAELLSELDELRAFRRNVECGSFEVMAEVAKLQQIIQDRDYQAQQSQRRHTHLENEIQKMSANQHAVIVRVLLCPVLLLLLLLLSLSLSPFFHTAPFDLNHDMSSDVLFLLLDPLSRLLLKRIWQMSIRNMKHAF